MASTVFSDSAQTPLVASWFNDVNNAVYNGVFPGAFTLAVTSGGTGATTTAGARSNLGLAIGTNVEAWNANLDALGALSGTGLLVQTGTNTFAERTLVAGSGVTITNASGVGGNITISQSGQTPTSITLNGSVSGALTITTGANAGSSNLTLETAGNGTSTMTFPSATDTVACLGQSNTFTAPQTFEASGIKLLGSSTGATVLHSANSGSSNNTLTVPSTTTDTLAALGTTQTWTAAQIFTNGDLQLAGGSTGKTTLESGLSGGSNNTLILPTSSSDTLAALGTNQTWTGTQLFDNDSLQLAGSSSGTTFLNAAATAGSTTLTLQGTTGTVYSSGGTPVAVTDGGTGQGSGYTAYSPILAGTTGTGAFQDSGTLGAAGTILTSNGVGVAPTWQSGSGGVSLAGNNTWTGIQSFNNAKLALVGTSTGKTTLESGLGSSSNNTITLPITATDTLAGLGTVQTFTANQTFGNGNLLLAGSSSGSTTLEAAATASGVITFPATTDTVALIGTAQTWTAAQSVTHGDLKLIGTSTGQTTLNSGLGSSSNNILTLPITATDTLAGLGTVQTWSAAQTFNNNDFLLAGSSSGTTKLNAAVTAGTTTITFPGVTDTAAVLGTAQSWTAAQTFNNSDIKLLGSSSGATTLTSANGGASNFTLTLPAVSDTVATLATAQTWSAAQSFTTSDFLLKGSSSGSTTLNSGLSSTSSNTLVLPTTSSDTLAALGTTQTWSATQTFSNPITVPSGGTGVATMTTAYGVVCAGTTATGNLQAVSSLGTSGQVLTSQGNSSLPHWTTVSGGGGTNLGTAYLVSTNQFF